MYYYLVDPSKFEGKNFEFYQTQLLALLGEYHVAGEVARVTKLRTVGDLVATAFSRGVSTLVVVGDDETFNQVVGVCKGKPVTLGYVPINDSSEVAQVFGIRSLEEAVATIAKRRVVNLDLAKVGENYFIAALNFGFLPEKFFTAAPNEPMPGWFSSLRAFSAIAPQEVTLTFDGNFSATSKLLAGSIINVRDHSSVNPEVSLGDPRDQLLDAVMTGELSKFQAFRYRKLLADKSYEAVPGGSVVHAKTIEIKSPEGLPIYLSGRIIAHTPVTVTIGNQTLRVIVGKERQF